MSTSGASSPATLADGVPPDGVVVVGEPGSGTRLVTRIIQAGGYRVTHDATHGSMCYWHTGTVVLVTRDPAAREASWKARYPDGLDLGASTTAELRDLYPDAVEVAYEDVVADVVQVIYRLSGLLGTGELWEFGEEVYDGNAESGSRCVPTWGAPPRS